VGLVWHRAQFFETVSAPGVWANAGIQWARMVGVKRLRGNFRCQSACW